MVLWIISQQFRPNHQVGEGRTERVSIRVVVMLTTDMRKIQAA
jgi:hypothetical protein